MVSPITIEDTRALGPYRLLRPLGEHVFLAERPDGEPVAVQAVPAGAAADPRFPGQVAAARTLSAAQAAPVVDTDLDTTSLVAARLVATSLAGAGPAGAAAGGMALEDDGPWLATAYVAGPSLADLVREHGPLPGPAALELAARLAEGLRDMHAAGLVHGNLKPSNVVLAPDGPRLTGYGIWNAADVPGQDPGFLSPEQVQGQDAEAPGDIFSLSAVLAFAGAGHGPFGSGSTAALMYRLVNSPAQLDELEGGIRAVAERGLAKEPAARPTAAELVAVLDELRPSGEWHKLGLPVVTVPGPRTAAEAQLPPEAVPAAVPAADVESAGTEAAQWWWPGSEPQAEAGAGAGMGTAARAFSSGNGRNGRWRSRAPVWITGSVLAVLAAVALLATGVLFPGRGGQGEPQAGTAVAATGSQQAPAGSSPVAASPGPASAPGQARLTRAGGPASSSPLILGGSAASVFVSLPPARAAAAGLPTVAKAAPSGAASTAARSSAPAKSSAPASHPASSAPAPSPPASSPPATSSSGTASASPSAPASSAPAPSASDTPSAPDSSAPASSPPDTSSADPSATASAS